MIQFGIYVAMLLLTALAFVLVPLLVNKGLVKESDDQTNIQLAKAKLQELQDDLAAGNLTRAQYDAAKQEVEVALYHDLQATARQVENAGKGRWLAIPLLFLVPIVALGLYAQFGDFRTFDETSYQTAVSPDRADKASQVNAMVEGLAKRLEQQPDDMQGWIMLGRSYKALKRYSDAVATMQKARQHLGDKPDILLQLADAMAMAGGGSLNGEAGQLIAKALELEPENEMALWLYGMLKAEQDQYQEAIQYWQKLQRHYQPQDPNYKEVQNLIDEANQRLGNPVAAKTADAIVAVPQTAKTAYGTVNVKIELADSFKNKVGADDAVIIYAQAVNGPKAPLAAVKKQVKDLPLQLTLDESMAMMPEMTVTSVDHIRVTARVSVAGSAVPQSGEPIGSVEVQGAGRSAVKVVIEGTVP